MMLSESTIHPLFSIIVPVYNVELYLTKCIESCLSQSFKDFEIILVDDGSTDSSKDICDQYGSKYGFIKTIHKINGGLVSARKAGISYATGQYTVCLDADDWLDCSFLSEIQKVIVQYKPDIVCCGFYRAFDNSLKKIPFSFCEGFLEEDDIIKTIFPSLLQNKKGEYFPPSVWAKAYKTDLYKECQMSVNDLIKIGEDCACVVPAIYKAESMYCLNKCLYYYRQNKTSMTRGKRVFDFNGPKLLYNHFSIAIDLNEYDFKEQIYRKITHELFLVAVSQFYKKERYKAICETIDKELNDECYVTSLNNAFFEKSFFAKLMHKSLKKRYYLLLKIYSALKSNN